MGLEELQFLTEALILKTHVIIKTIIFIGKIQLANLLGDWIKFFISFSIIFASC